MYADMKELHRHLSKAVDELNKAQDQTRNDSWVRDIHDQIMKAEEEVRIAIRWVEQEQEERELAQFGI